MTSVKENGRIDLGLERLQIDAVASSRQKTHLKQCHSEKDANSKSKYWRNGKEKQIPNHQQASQTTKASGSKSHVWKPKNKNMQKAYPQTTTAGMASKGTGNWPMSAISAPMFQPRILLHNPFDPECPSTFRIAMDSIFGLPLGGSLAFMRNGSSSPAETVWRCVGQGPAKLSSKISDKISVSIESGGFLDGDYSKILVNGVDYSPNQKGFNILVMDPMTLDAYVGVFDTHSQLGNESRHLTQFLRGIPDTSVVLVSIRHDASRRLHPEARQTLIDLGMKIPENDNAKKLETCVELLDAEKSSELLSMCAAVNAPECANTLIKHGWNKDYQKQHGSKNSPLLDAAFHGSVDVARVLLENGADRSLKNKWNETAEDMAVKLFGFQDLDQMVSVNPPNETGPEYKVTEMDNDE